MNEFYPEIEPYDQQFLSVGDNHQLYIEQCGNPLGQPVVFIHGGPGAGCSTNDRRFFDPQEYRIILFDQRGCGRSLPHGSLLNNDTVHLIADIEKIRQTLNISQWHVFGGSWGSTLGLVYAQHHPTAVLSLVLRGIFLAREQDIQWTFSGGGASRIYPDHWQEFLAAFEGNESKASIKGAYELMIGEDKALALKVARAWSLWEIRCCTLIPNKEYVDAVTGDDSCWTLARHEAHFMLNGCFLTDNQILSNCHKIAHIPTVIVHGRYDVVCTIDNAWELHKRLPESTLYISDAAGHASAEPQTKHQLIAATQKMLTVVK
jgi:proline iminopeptidase